MIKWSETGGTYAHWNNVAQHGNLAQPDNLVEAAKAAERLGYSTLWAADRLLYPVKPRTKYPVTADGSLPDFYKRVLDPIEVLTFVAAHTGRIGLGTSVLDIPFYNPVTLARRLTSLDILSNGRLRAGFGLGWSVDEFEAAGADQKERGARADEFLAALKTIWREDPVEFHGKYFSVPRSIIGAKPVQKPHPPIYLAAYAPAALKRAATMANGWMPVGIPLDGMAAMITQLRQLASDAGRDPRSLEVIVGANISITPKAVGADRPTFAGSEDQIRNDIEAVKQLSAGEIFFIAFPEGGIKDLAATMERYRSFV
ncbi:MAG TPA: LLM class F420-dependent oxidoreductase [Candidatus Binatia bacterium]